MLLFLLTAFTVTQASSSEPTIIHILSNGFENCHIDVLEFKQYQILKPVGEFPLLRWLIRSGSSSNIYKLQSLPYWLSRKSFCELILILNAPDPHSLDEAVNKYRYPGQCNGVTIHCNEKGRYIVSAYDLRHREFSPGRIPTSYIQGPWGQKIIFYQVTLFQTHVRTDVGVGLPCNSILTATFIPEPHVNKRKLFDQMHRKLLSVACQFEFWITGRQHKVEPGEPEFMSYSHGKPTFRRIAEYVFKHIQKALNKSDEVGFIYRAEIIPPGYISGNSLFATAECDAGNPTVSFGCRASFDIEGTFVFYTKQISYNFLSCATVDKLQSYTAYIRPFDMVVWIYSVAALVGVAVFLYITYRPVTLSMATVWPLMVLFAQAITVHRKLKSCSSFKIILTALFLSTIVLINTYRGKITTELIAPKPKPHIEYVKDAFEQGFKVLLPVNTRKSSWLDEAVDKLPTYLPEKDQHFHWITLVYYEMPLTFKMVEDYVQQYGGNESKRIYEEFIRNLFYKPFDRVPRNHSFINELKKCSQSIYIATQSEVEEVLVELAGEDSDKKFYLGKDKAYTSRRYWTISPIHWDRWGQLGMHFHHFWQSGIISFIESIHEKVIKRKVGKIQLTETYTALNLQGKIGSLFLIYIWFSLLCILGIVMEHIYATCKYIR